VIRGFHSDNGSQFINYNVARLLDKLRIEQTKSSAHHCGDNGLVETKNGAVIRKHIGFGYIDAKHAEAVDRFHRDHLNPYVNFHRPCAIPKILTAANGKRRGNLHLRFDEGGAGRAIRVAFSPTLPPNHPKLTRKETPFPPTSSPVFRLTLR
jgi:transposase InsO family protein